MSRHAKWCPEKGKPPNMSGGYCSTCGEKVKPAPVSSAVEEPEVARARGGWQDPSTDIENVNAAYVIERDENARLRAEVERLRDALAEIADGHERHNPGWWIKQARAALAGSPSGKETPE
jgi:hypothetical protein